MPKKKVIVEGQIILDDKGTLKKSAKGAHSVDRRLKGAARTSSSATKNFSKMSQGISGGLVPAYATLAANIFAIGAAFRFLSEAANYRILVEGQKEFATVTGQSLELLTDRLQTATGQQLAFKEAAQATAIAMAAGVTTDQLVRIGNVAKNASIALGRDLTDSLNRLIRGVTKAEPELLDELGIILRLEIASQKYADRMGLVAKDLTIFQKSQAVVNEVLEQGEEKFGEFSTGLNEIAKLAKSFDDLMNKVRITVTKFAEFVGKGLSRNVIALAGAFAMLGSGVAKAIFPVPQAHPQQTFDRAQADVGKWYTGKDADKFKTGQFGSKEISRLEKTINTKAAKEGRSTVLDYERFKRNEARKTLEILKLQSLEREQHEGNSFQRMKARWKFTLASMKAEYGGFVGTIKFLGLGLTKLMSAAGYIGLVIAGFSMIKEWVSRMGDPAVQQFAESQKEVAEALEKQANAVKELNANLVNTSTLMAKIVQLSKFMGNFSFQGASGAFGGGAAATLGSGSKRSGWNKFVTAFGQAGALQGRNTQMAREMGENLELPALSETQVSIVMSTIDALETQKTLVRENTEEYDDLTKRLAIFEGVMAEVAKMGGTITPAQFKKMSDALFDLGNKGTVAQQRLAGLSSTTTILTGAVQGFTKALGNLRGTNTDLGKLSTEIGTVGKTLTDLGNAKLDAFVDLGGTFDKAFDTATAGVVETFIGKAKYDEIMAKKSEKIGSIIPPRGSGTAMVSKYTDQEILGMFGEATSEKAKEIFDMEMRHIKAKNDIETEYMTKKRKLPKIVQQQLDKEMKVDIIDAQLTKNTETRAMLESLGLEQNAAKIAALDAQNAKLKIQMKLAKEASSFAGQAYQTFVDTLGSSLSTALNDFATGAKNMKDAFLDMTQSILKAMVQILAQQAAIRALGFMGFPTGREGGIFQSPGYKSFAGGGVATGSQSGYLAKLHGTEAVVPLGNDKAIPVEFKGGGGSVSNVTVNVAAGGQQQTTTAKAGERERKLGQMIAAAVQGEILDQQRPGGILSPYGDGGG